MKRKLSFYLTLPLLVCILLIQTPSASQIIRAEEPCKACIKCFEHAPDPSCTCKQVCKKAAERGCTQAFPECKN